MGYTGGIDVIHLLQAQNLPLVSRWNKSTKQHVSGSQYYPLRNDSTFKGNKNVAIVDRIPKKRTQTDEADLYQVH